MAGQDRSPPVAPVHHSVRDPEPIWHVAVTMRRSAFCTFTCILHVCMLVACLHYRFRNVPEHLHRQIKARAALEGQSLSEYALSELRRAMQRPTRRELIERVAAFERITVKESAVDMVRAERDSR